MDMIIVFLKIYSPWNLQAGNPWSHKSECSSQLPLIVFPRVVAVVAFGVVVVAGTAVAVSFVVNVLVVVAFSFVVVLIEMFSVIGGVDTDAVVLAVVRLVVTCDVIIEGAVILVVGVIVEDVLILGPVVVLDTIVASSMGALVLVSNAAAVVLSVCTIAVPVVVVAVGSVVVLADVIADNSGDIAYVVSFVELAELVLFSAKCSVIISVHYIVTLRPSYLADKT